MDSNGIAFLSDMCV